jgi:hypothetical protein
MLAQRAVLENKKGDSRNGYPLKWAQKKAKEPLSIRGSFACDFLFTFGKTYPIQPRLFLYLLCCPALLKVIRLAL